MLRLFFFAVALLAALSSNVKTLYSQETASSQKASNLQGLYFASAPFLTPDGSEIYFSYGGDIFRVATKGGLALKVISMGGIESDPKVSPDGKLLAFSSNEQGNKNVYVVPLKGGEIKQLTFHEDQDSPVCWSADSKFIYFESNRYNSISAYKVSVTGGTPERLFPNYYNTIANLVVNAVTGEFYFNESTESYRFATRKGYRGDHNPDIKSWNPITKEFKVITEYRGKDIWPMVDLSGNLYYVSDEQNGEANIVRFKDGKYLTSFDESVMYPSISAGGSKIVFLKGYKIFVLETGSGEVFEPAIELAKSSTVASTSLEVGRPDAFAISPDGKKIAFTSRGLLFVSDAKGNFITPINTPMDQRVKEIVWAPDSKTVYYTRTNGGYLGLFSQSVIAKENEKAVYTPEASIRSLTHSLKNDKIAFINGGGSVMLLDVKSGDVKELSKHEFWAFQNYSISFSNNQRFITYSAVNLFERDVFVYDLLKDSCINITNSANAEGDPVFGAKDKDLYFLSNRMNASFPRGASMTLYKVPLFKRSAPLKSDEFSKLFAAKDTASAKQTAAKSAPSKSSKKTRIVANSKTSANNTLVNNSLAANNTLAVIDLENIQRRYETVVRGGIQSAPYLMSVGERNFILFNSTHEGTMGLYVQEIKDWDQAAPKKIKDAAMIFSYDRGSNDLYGIGPGGVYKIDPVGGSATAISFKHKFDKNIHDEFNQMFYEVWATLEQNFYDVKFHGVDWKAKRDYYASFLPYVVTRDNLRTLLNDMLNELNSSHMGFSTSGRDESSSVQYVTNATGLMFDEKNPYVLDRIVSGSVADFEENPLLKGDRLVSVNGVAVDPSRNREFYFSTVTRQEEMVLGFERSGAKATAGAAGAAVTAVTAANKVFEVKLHTFKASALRALLHTEWADLNRARATELSGGRAAYIHMSDMSSESLEAFIIAMNTYAVHKDALILDLRFNNGGNVHKEVLDMLASRENFRWSHRDNPKISHPNVTPANKPLVVLINERSLSDAEVTANGIKTLSLATLVGTETYRWIIFTSGAMLIDGSNVRLPAWGCYTLDGKNMEVEGVTPDIYVMNTFKDRLESKDPQLERAVKEVLSQLGKN